MFFVNLIYGHFDILMFQNGQIKKVALSQVCAIVVNSPILQGRRTQIPPKHIPSPYISMNTTQIPIDTPLPQTSLTHPQTSPGNSRSQQMKTDANRHKETPPDTLGHCQVLFEYVWRCLFGAWCCLLTSWLPWRCLGGIWGVSEWYSVKWRRPEVFEG